MAENTAFSPSGEDVISRTIEVTQESVPQEESFADYYEIERTVQEISRGDYKRVHFNWPLVYSGRLTFIFQIALQFPDEMLHDSVPIFRALKSGLSSDRELYVLADTSYGRQAIVV